MKNRIMLLLALVCVVFAGTASADPFRFSVSKLKWYQSNGSLDSTLISVAFADGDGVTNADTTLWVDLGAVPLATASNGTTTATPIIQAQVSAQQAASGDSMQVIVQWSNDGATVNSTSAVHAVTAQNLVGQVAPVFNVLDSDDTGAGRFYRIIFINNDGSVKRTRRTTIWSVTRVRA